MSLTDKLTYYGYSAMLRTARGTIRITPLKAVASRVTLRLYFLGVLYLLPLTFMVCYISELFKVEEEK